MPLPLSLLLLLWAASMSDFGNMPTGDTYMPSLLIPLFSPVNEFLFDGPKSVANAPIPSPTTPTPTPTHIDRRQPTLEQMKYYNYYSASAYCIYEIQDLSCEYCQKFKGDVNEYKVIKNNSEGTLALITVSNSRREIVVAYRGSANIYNLILDFIMRQTTHPDTPSDIKLHAGFLKATNSLYEKVVAAVGSELEKYPDYKVVTTGHSLGGSMAKLTVFFLSYLNKFPSTQYEVYTYGEPRTGNKAYVDYMNQLNITSARVVARGDLVPHGVAVSLVSDITGDYYLHTQTEYWDNGSKSKFCNTSVYEDPECSSKLGPMYSQWDHGIYFDVSYLTCIAAQPAASASIPRLVDPVKMLPALPKHLASLVGGGANLFYYMGRPIFG